MNGSRWTIAGLPAIRFHHENWMSSPAAVRPVRVLPRTMFVSMRKAAARCRSVSGPQGDAVGSVEAQELGEHDRLRVLVVVLQQLDAVDRGQGEQGLPRPLLARVPLLDRAELAAQDRDEEVAVPGCRLEEGLVDEVGAGLQAPRGPGRASGRPCDAG